MDIHPDDPHGSRHMTLVQRFLGDARAQARALHRRAVHSLLLRRRSQVWLVAVLASVAGFVSFSVLRAAGTRPVEFVACAAQSGTNRDAAASEAIPAGWRGVAMPRDVVAPQVGAGDTVDVVADGRLLAAGAVIISAGTETEGPVVAVPAEVAPAVASAAQTGASGLVTTG
jgi:hypothetical protein